MVNLRSYDNSWFNPGKSKIVCCLWYISNALLIYNPFLPFSNLKIIILRWFGAKIGRDVIIKPRVNIKYPWKLEIGDNSWIGENVWFDNLDKIIVAENVCISQGSYLCTGNHDWSDRSFGLIIRPIEIRRDVWVGAFSRLSPGVIVGEGAVLQLGSVVSGEVPPYMVCGGCPCVQIKKRTIE